jgi:3-hydroxyisobutyrate dehydrogenase-like beta-hydroxyacid dehydrogenase
MNEAPTITVAILSPGDMGHGIGRVLREGGARVITCLRGRSQRTRSLAALAGIEDVADLDAVAQQADIILSIMVPGKAVALGAELAAALKRTAGHPVIVDCNAISPATARRIAETIEEHGGLFVDAGIIGVPPADGTHGPRLYVSGHNARELLVLRDFGIDVRVVGDQVGQASGLKMCYASVTKGFTALATIQQTAALALGLSEHLNRELALSNPAVLAWMEAMVPSMPPKAYRWVGEMEEIAATFDALGLPPRMMLGAADLYALTAATSLGTEVPESRASGESMNAVARILVEEHLLRGTAPDRQDSV